MAKQSITRRLIISVVVTQLILTISLAALATYVTWRQLRRSFDALLHARAMSVAALVRFSEEQPSQLIFDSTLVPPALDRETLDQFQIRTSAGSVLASSAAWPSDFPTKPKQQRVYWTAPYGGNEYRIIRLENVPVLDREGPDTATAATVSVVYAASTREIRERAWAVVLTVCTGSLVLLSISIAVTIWLLRRGLSPLSALATSAGQVTASEWALRAPEQARETEELAPLIAAMDSMLATLHQAFTSQREFVANAAHELKTPIAVLKSTLQSLIQRPRTAAEYRHQVEAALEDVDRLEALTHSMLRLARAERGGALKASGDLPLVELAATCELSAERLRSVAAAKAVRVELDASSSPELRAEAEDLELIWTNLIENAIRYSPAGSAVIVAVSQADHRARVEVRDSGPGIHDAELKHIFDRFHRADASRSRQTGGYGLGLAIAKAMVEAYGGKIEVESGIGRGTTMSVILPLQP